MNEVTVGVCYCIPIFGLNTCLFFEPTNIFRTAISGQGGQNAQALRDDVRRDGDRVVAESQEAGKRVERQERRDDFRNMEAKESKEADSVKDLLRRFAPSFSISSSPPRKKFALPPFFFSLFFI